MICFRTCESLIFEIIAWLYEVMEHLMAVEAYKRNWGDVATTTKKYVTKMWNFFPFNTYLESNSILLLETFKKNER